MSAVVAVTWITTAGMLTSFLGAVETAPPISVRLADGETLIRHAEASIYGRLWNDPVCDPLREPLRKALAEIDVSLGVKSREVLAAISGPALRVEGFTQDDGVTLPQLSARLDAGVHAERLLTTLASYRDQVIAAAVPGAASAIKPFEDLPLIVARCGAVLVGTFGVDPQRVQPWPAPPAVADLHLVADLPRLAALYRAAEPGQELFALGELADLRSVADARYDLRIDLVTSGIREHLSMEPLRPGLRPVDRTQLARLPSHALMVCAVGIAGGPWWQAHRRDLLAEFGVQYGIGDADAAGRWLDERFAAWQLPDGLDATVSSLDGTVLAAVTPGMPVPGMTLVFPRSPAIDRLVRAALAEAQTTEPLPGQVVQMTLPGLLVQVAVDERCWLVSSDAVLAATWSQGQAGGWAESAAGTAALAQARADAFIIGASDTPAVLRTIVPAVQSLLSVGADLQRRQLQAALLALMRLSSMASTGWLVGHPTARGAVIEDQGLVGMMSLVSLGGMAAGISEGLAMNRRAQRDETPVVDILRNVIFPAEMRFQAARHCDQDGDGIGEFGLLDELAGLRPTGRVAAGTVTLVPGDLLTGHLGHEFFVYLPAADGGTVEEPEQKAEARPADAIAAKAQARRFVAYAWPTSVEAGERVFAITQEGTVHVAPHAGGTPNWNALFGGKGWETKPVWEVWKARAKKGGQQRR